MTKQRVDWNIWKTIGIFGSACSIVGVLYAIFSDLINPETGALILIALLCLAWILSVEIRLSRINTEPGMPVKKIYPKPIIQECNKEPLFIYNRKKRKDKEIPFIDSSFLDLDNVTFCLWVNVVPELRKTKTNRYIFSHASDWRDNTKYPNALCLYHSAEFKGWVLRFHGDPMEEGDRLKSKKFLSSPGEDGVRLFTTRWRKNQGELEVLLDDKVKYKLSGFINWPKSASKPVFLGGWIKGGWDSYIRTKIFNVRVFNEWLNDDQIASILNERPDM